MSESPLGQTDLADVLVGRSQTTRPGGGLIWTLHVTDQLVEACDDWSPPVEFKFQRLEDGRLEMLFRRRFDLEDA